MATLREIRRRIRSVTNISKVTKAMQMVAAAKMRRAQEQVLATRPYAEKALELLVHLAGQSGTGEALHPLLQVRPTQRTGLLLISGDKGLCGGYNHNVIRAALDYAEGLDGQVQLVIVGRKARDYVRRTNFEAIAEFTDLPPQSTMMDTTPISHILMQGFLDGSFDQVVLAYTRFVNTLVQRPVIQPLLPLQYKAEGTSEVEDLDEPESVGSVEYIYEPDPRTILDTVIPRFTEMQVYQAILEATASEHSARMVAMQSATDNAERLTEDLTLSYHQARQWAITSEMLDIVGGAEALSQGS